MDLGPKVILRPHLRTLEADGPAPGPAPGLEVGHHHEAGADGGSQGAGSKLGDRPLVEAGVGQSKAAIHLDLQKFHFE